MNGRELLEWLKALKDDELDCARVYLDTGNGIYPLEFVDCYAVRGDNGHLAASICLAAKENK